MLLPDVNVLIYAHRPESPRHDQHRAWLLSAANGTRPLGVSELVLSSFLRLVTHHRIYQEPTPVEQALQFCTSLLGAPAATDIRPGPRHWSLFTDLVDAGQARGNLVPDAYLAALALEHGATLITTDRGFSRWPGLSWSPPLD